MKDTGEHLILNLLTAFRLFLIFYLCLLFLGYHGRGGPLVVSSGVATSLSDRVYKRGMEELGYKTWDCNGESQAGIIPT